MRIFFSTLGTETNTFSPIPAGWNVWRETLLRRTADGAPTLHAHQRSFRPLYDVANARGAEIVPGLQAFAAPSGRTPAAVRAALEAELLADLDNAGAIDGVLLHLHGAMVADDEDDCEGALLGAVRRAIGDRPLAALLDLHCHLTPRMIQHADLLFGYREYPHIDTYARLGSLLHALADCVEGHTRPVMALADCGMLGMYPTTTTPMRQLVNAFEAESARGGMIDVWLGHGFPWGDVDALGTRVLAIADGDLERAKESALRMADVTWHARASIANAPIDLDSVLDEALAVDATAGPVVIADTADNTGGGAPGDSTFFLDALLARRVSNTLIGPLYDPGAVTLCHDAGVGARMRLRIGGKLCAESGLPVDVDAVVLAVADDVRQVLNAAPAHLGPCAAVRCGAPPGGPVVVLASRRIQAGSPELFTALGLEPSGARLVVVKSTQHFHAGFAPIASAVLYCGAPGALAGDVRRIEYARAPAARLWPFTHRPEQRGIIAP
ncbi:MAG: M81 family metallopeptidase [Pseudomonadales bacterium]|nr:M81 family metallopeptidase [Pseudomonadales bacterium]